MSKVAVVVGSVHRNSLNRKLAVALARLAAPKLDLQIVEIGDLPYYDAELEASLPASVAHFRSAIAAADAVLVVTPEYNRSIPGVLKNAIDWGSRPYGKGVWIGKPAAIMGATPGATGTAAAQQHLRTLMGVVDTALMGQPEAYITLKPDSFDADGNLADESMRGFLTMFLDRFAAWIRRTALVAA